MTLGHRRSVCIISRDFKYMEAEIASQPVQPQKYIYIALLKTKMAKGECFFYNVDEERSHFKMTGGEKFLRCQQERIFKVKEKKFFQVKGRKVFEVKGRKN